MRQETMPAVIQTWKGVEKHIDTHRPTTQNWGAGPPEFSHQIESFLLCQIPSCFTEGPRIYWTFPDLPEHRCYYLSFFPFVPKSVLPPSRDPGRAPKCSAHSPSPRSGKKTPRNSATRNRGIYYWLEPGPRGCEEEKAPSPSSLGYLLGQRKAADSWHKQIGYTAGSWHKRIGYTVARQFLLAQCGAFSFPLIGSLFLARHMLIG